MSVGNAGVISSSRSDSFSRSDGEFRRSIQESVTPTGEEFNIMYSSKAYSAASETAPLAVSTISRRDPADNDVQIDILFCGICHSDLHQVRNEWKSAAPTVYPCVPGHEIVGRVLKVGSGVKKFKVGDIAGVGCVVDSDRTCPECQSGFE